MQMSSTSPERYSCQPATGRRRTSSMRCRVRRCGGPAPSSPPPARLQLVSAAPVRNRHAQLRHVVPSRRSWARVRGVGRWPLARERNGSRTCREGCGPPSSNGLDRLKLDSQVHAPSLPPGTASTSDRIRAQRRDGEGPGNRRGLRRCGRHHRRVAPGTSTRSCASTPEQSDERSWATSGRVGPRRLRVARGRAPLSDPTLTDGT
jgi:hypothetical protein